MNIGNRQTLKLEKCKSNWWGLLLKTVIYSFAKSFLFCRSENRASAAITFTRCWRGREGGRGGERRRRDRRIEKVWGERAEGRDAEVMREEQRGEGGTEGEEEARGRGEEEERQWLVRSSLSLRTHFTAISTCFKLDLDIDCSRCGHEVKWCTNTSGRAVNLTSFLHIYLDDDITSHTLLQVYIYTVWLKYLLPAGHMQLFVHPPDTLLINMCSKHKQNAQQQDGAVDLPHSVFPSCTQITHSWNTVGTK